MKSSLSFVLSVSKWATESVWASRAAGWRRGSEQMKWIPLRRRRNGRREGSGQDGLLTAVLWRPRQPGSEWINGLMLNELHSTQPKVWKLTQNSENMEVCVPFVRFNRFWPGGCIKNHVLAMVFTSPSPQSLSADKAEDLLTCVDVN